jgi:tetratricopeptide (TPR) repeat protein
MSAFQYGIEFIQRYWYEVKGLLFALLINLILHAWLCVHKLSNIFLVFLVYIISSIFISIVWFLSRRLPKTKKGKIGILICFYCPEKEEKSRFKEDFIRTLQELMNQSKKHKLFHFLIMPDRVTEKVLDIEDANILRIKCKAHFVLWGRVRNRIINGTPHHVLKMDGIVIHKKVSPEIKKSLSDEFSLLPRKVIFENQNDFLAFEFTSDWIHCVAKYIIGIAAAISDDFDLAEKLLREVLEILEIQKSDFPVFSILRRRIPLRLVEICGVKFNMYFYSWLKTHSEEYIDKIGELIKNYPTNLHCIYEYKVCKAIHIFLKDRDVEGSIKLLKSCKKIQSPVWHLNLAFLYAYSNDMKLAIREYRKAEELPISLETLYEIENFIFYFLEIEPDKYQLSYCLGYINWKIKDNKEQAIKNFTDFLKKGDARDFAFEREQTKKWLAQIQNE